MTQRQAYRTELVRLTGITIAVALLNAGLYVVLFVLAPFVAGAIGGYLVSRIGSGTLVGLLGALFVYPLLIGFLDVLQGSMSDPLVILQAAFILSLIGAFGGTTGSIIASWVSRNSSV